MALRLPDGQVHFFRLRHFRQLAGCCQITGFFSFGKYFNGVYVSEASVLFPAGRGYRLSGKPGTPSGG